MRKYLLPLTLALLLLITGAIAAMQTDRLTRLTRTLEEVGLQALHQSAEEMQALTLDLEKLLVSGQAAQQAALLHRISLTAGDVQQCLASLPLSHEAMAGTLTFVGELRDDAAAMLPALTSQALTAAQLERLSACLASCAQLSSQLSLARQAMEEDGMTLMQNRSVFTADASAGQRPLEQLGSGEEGVIYPPAQVQLPAAPRGLPEGDVTREEARQLARDFVGAERALAVSDAPDASGVLPAYGVTVQTGDVLLNLEITRQGGQVLWMMPETASFTMTQSPSACESAALSFLQEHGFGQAEAVHRQLYDGLCVVSFAPVQEDVLLYPDLLTVQVRMDTLEVVGLEARAYWTNHVLRSLPEPALSAGEAAALLSDQAEAQEHRLCLIPEGEGETLCWQFTVTRGGETYLVYLDAQDGREIAIRKLIPLENGSTAA
ncbi:MAG: PepSY1/2 domain-containing protein [Aristaeellaceae bacterium]